MPAVLESQTSALARKRWTRSDCAALEAAGLFLDEKLELVEGDLFSRTGKKQPHIISQGLLLLWLQQSFGARFVLQEAPIDVAAADNPTSEPEPDLLVLSRDYTTFRLEKPQPSDLQLVVEIADTTLATDLNVKGPLYARAGIVEYWLLDINARALIVHRNPQNGLYQFIRNYIETEAIAPLTAPTHSLLVSDAFLSA